MRVVDAEGVEVGVGEPGEIQISGPNVMKGYWNLPDATAAAIDADGWFASGDVGRVDEDGYFYIVDRKKDMIIRGGLNVYPREIEEVLYEHPAVVEAAVVGIPHDSLGEDIGAAVALRAGISPRKSIPRRSSRSSASASPPTSTRAGSGSSTPCPRVPPARSSAVTSSSPTFEGSN